MARRPRAAVTAPTRFWASGVLAIAVDRAGTVTGFVKIMRDVTEQKVTEDNLKAAMLSAEQAQSAAMEANRAKDEFIAVVSHELRTPLNTIRLWSRMLRNEKLTAKDRADGIEMVERAAVTAFVRAADRQQILEAGFDEHIPKPVDADQLIAVAVQLLRR